MTKLTVLLPTLLSGSLLAIALGYSTTAQADYDCEYGNLEESYDCAANAVQNEKGRLNKVYMDIYRKLNSTQKSQMDTEQMAWINQRDSNCISADDGSAMGTMMVYLEISDMLCIAHETEQRSEYYINDFDANHLTRAAKGAVDFRKVTRSSDGDITYYQGLTQVSGVIDVTHPQDDISPCGLCFKVSIADNYKIPKEIGDNSTAWFAFNNTFYEPMVNKYRLGNLTIDSQKCYDPIKATVEIKDFKTDRRETETIDETTFVRFISVDKPQQKPCEVIPY